MRGDGVRVLIVGAGVAGLTTARLVRRWGAEVELIERTPAPVPSGTGIYLLGNALRALEGVGLARPVADLAVRIRRQCTADHRGRPLFDIDADEIWGGIGPCLAMHRADLHRILLDGAADIPIRWADSPAAITKDGPDVIVETTASHVGRYDLVVGADGVHSTVRRLIFEGGGATPVGQYAYRFLAPWDGPPDRWSVRLGQDSAFLTIPIGNGQVYCYCDGPIRDPITPLRNLLSDYAEPIGTLLGTLDTKDSADVQAGPIEEVVLDTWSRGNVLLIGDAAHATSPNMAQGAAMALEDALILAESLDTATRITQVPEAFERRRRPRTDWVLAQSHRRDRARNLKPGIRDVALRHFGKRIVRANYRPLIENP
jgi:2-polyprenyl-6-methoxyphenol hydroxylase-like FAD-dependent oxidoreductase